jgi:EmrB/QacA subfamily drug resistance transporter
MDPTSRPQRPHLRATLALACLAQFMVILDVSVVNVALPSIHRALGFTLSDLQWVVNAYTVTFAGFLLLGGRAADLLGRRRVFVSGLVLFALASLAGGLSDSQTVLIGARLIQGLGAAVIAPASLSIITSTFTEPRERNRAVGMWGAMGGAGGAAGVLLGGILTDLLSWRWVLFINLPIGLIAAYFAQRMIAEGRNPGATRSFDLSGALSATVGLSLLVLGIVRTDTTGWGNGETLGLMIAGLALLGVFLVIEGRLAKAPLMPLHLFSSRGLSTGNLVMMMVGASTFAMWFFFSLYLQDVRGYSPLHAGVIFLPMTLSIVVFSTVASRVTLRLGAKRLLVGGMLGLAVGMFLFAQLTPTSSYVGGMLVPGLLTSIALPFGMIPATIAGTAGVPRHEAGLASGVINTARMFGGALGLAILATLASSQSRADLHHPTAQIHSAAQALVGGFDLAFLVAAGMAAAGVVIAIAGMPSLKSRVAEATQPQKVAVDEAPQAQRVAVEV